MKIWTVVLSSSILLACGSSKDVQIDNISIEPENISDSLEIEPISITDFNVVISITHHYPYCGGAPPSQEIIANQTMPQANTSFILLDLSSNEKNKVTANSEGKLNLSLSKGKYAIREMFKDCTLDDFRSQNPVPTGENYEQSLDPDCYEKWWKSNLIEFEITNTDSMYNFSCQSADQCFTGNNPCVIYTGPWPP